MIKCSKKIKKRNRASLAVSQQISSLMTYNIVSNDIDDMFQYHFHRLHSTCTDYSLPGIKGSTEPF